MSEIEIPESVFDDSAWDAGFDMEEIHYGTYQGRGYAKNCIGLVGDQGNIAHFFFLLGMKCANGEIDQGKATQLISRMDSDNMGPTQSIYYWDERTLKLTEG